MNNLRSNSSFEPNTVLRHQPCNTCLSIQHRTAFGWAATALAIVALIGGCSDPSRSTESTAEGSAPVVALCSQAGSQTLISTTTLEPSDQSPATQQEDTAASGLMDKAGKLFSGAQELTGQQATDTGQWLKGAWGGASDSTGSAIDGSLDWANETYKSLKDQGLTTASSTGQWLSEDWQNMESWQYKVLPTSSLPADELEDKLNELGKQGWECFSVDDQKLIFKKAPESYLRRLPFKDVLRLAPLLNQMKQ